MVVTTDNNMNCIYSNFVAKIYYAKLILWQMCVLYIYLLPISSVQSVDSPRQI